MLLKSMLTSLRCVDDLSQTNVPNNEINNDTNYNSDVNDNQTDKDDNNNFVSNVFFSMKI